MSTSFPKKKRIFLITFKHPLEGWYTSTLKARLNSKMLVSQIQVSLADRIIPKLKVATPCQFWLIHLENGTVHKEEDTGTNVYFFFHKRFPLRPFQTYGNNPGKLATMKNWKQNSCLLAFEVLFDIFICATHHSNLTVLVKYWMHMDVVKIDNEIRDMCRKKSFSIKYFVISLPHVNEANTSYYWWRNTFYNHYRVEKLIRPGPVQFIRIRCDKYWWCITYIWHNYILKLLIACLYFLYIVYIYTNILYIL